MNKSGILLVDKPANMTSFDVISRLRKIFKTKTIGHTGTLDPNATGLLVILINKATKIQPYLTNENKVYLATLLLGNKYDTGDIWGNIIDSKPIPELNYSKIINVFNSFIGDNYQIPPMTSAIKYQGKKLIDYQRKGIEIKREPRLIQINRLDLISFDSNSITFIADVSKGTYIRTLCEDIAEKLGTCGTMSALRRIKCGDFVLNNSHKLKDLTEDTELIALSSICNFRKVEYENISDIFNGRNIKLDCIDERVMIVHNNEELAIYRYDNGVYHCERGLW